MSGSTHFEIARLFACYYNAALHLSAMNKPSTKAEPAVAVAIDREVCSTTNCEKCVTAARSVVAPPRHRVPPAWRKPRVTISDVYSDNEG